MGQHAENDRDYTTDAANEPESYDPKVYDDERYDDERYDDEMYADVDDADAYDAARDPGPDVFLDVPRLKVDELNLDVENLRAHVSLQAEVLDLLKLNVGADVALGQVHLGISGVEAEARLKVRLDNVAQIINRVLTTLDRNPQILEDLARGVGSAVHDVGRGTATAVQDVGEGAGSAVEDVGAGAGEAVGEVAQGVAGGAGQAVGEVGGAAGRVVGSAGDTVRETGRAVGRGAGPAAEGPGTAEALGHSGTRRRRMPDDGSGATRPVRRRGARQRGEPP
ncbi:hypothetical protein [Streptomyces sp. enrichment culture]|uniref:hypothetical protein n=1 Tax=Streptomyces sp. enrichment culture TaxID=1795815 RepID=UPI003F576E0D